MRRQGSRNRVSNHRNVAREQHHEHIRYEEPFGDTSTNYVQPAARYSTWLKVTKQGDLWKSLVRRYQSNKTIFLGSSVSCSYEAYGSSGPGVTRDVFTSIAKELCDADLEHVQLFEQDDAQTYVLKRGLDRASRKMELVMFGEVMALVLLNRKNALLPIPFSLSS